MVQGSSGRSSELALEQRAEGRMSFFCVGIAGNPPLWEMSAWESVFHEIEWYHADFDFCVSIIMISRRINDCYSGAEFFITEI